MAFSWGLLSHLSPPAPVERAKCQQVEGMLEQDLLIRRYKSAAKSNRAAGQQREPNTTLEEQREPKLNSKIYILEIITEIVTKDLEN